MFYFLHELKHQRPVDSDVTEGVITTRSNRTKFRLARNHTNNAIKLAKKFYVSDNLEANKGNLRKTWNVINELTSRNSGKSTNNLEIKVDNKIASNPMDIAETINDHFTNVAQVLAQDIPVVDVNPDSY